MNTAKWMKQAVLALTFSLLLGACSGGADNNRGGSVEGTSDGALPVLTESPYVLAGTEEGVADFTAVNSGYESPYATDTCWNITPAVVSENSEFAVFKYGSSNATFVLYNGISYPIGGGVNSDGVTSMALADVTGDKVYDLCYAYSEGSSSHVGYFNPADGTANDLPGVIGGQAVVLSAEGNSLQVCAAEVSGYESLTAMTLSAGDKLAEVLITSDGPALEMASSSGDA